MNPLSPHRDDAGSEGPLLEAFKREARRGTAVVAYRAAEGSVVQAVGRADDGTELAWLGPTLDTTHDFLVEIGRRFGAAAQARVSAELGLQPTPGRPLASRWVEPALRIARRTRDVLAGVDFMTCVACSACCSGDGFLAACRTLALEPASLDADTRHRIDAAMAQRFAAARDLAGGAVSMATASDWLVDLLSQLPPGAPPP